MKKEIKKIFEENFLDGDKIQNGQMLSSKECLEAIEFFLQRERERIIEEIEKMEIEEVGNSAKTANQIIDIIKNIK